MGRPFNTSTPLGQRLTAMNMTAADLAHTSGVYVRTVSSYLAGAPMLDHHLTAFADALECEPEDLED